MIVCPNCKCETPLAYMESVEIQRQYLGTVDGVVYFTSAYEVNDEDSEIAGIQCLSCNLRFVLPPNLDMDFADELPPRAPSLLDDLNTLIGLIGDEANECWSERDKAEYHRIANRVKGV